MRDFVVSPHDPESHGFAALRQLCQPEIENARPPVRSDDYVPRLEVSMDDVRFVGGAQASPDLDEQREDVLPRARLCEPAV